MHADSNARIRLGMVGGGHGHSSAVSIALPRGLMIVTRCARGKPAETITRNGVGAYAVANRAARVPAGHPEGYLEGFAQLYADLAEQIRARRVGRAQDPAALLVPNVEDGARGVKFIEACLESSRAGAGWVDPRLEL